MKTVSIKKHLKLRIMRRRAVEGLTVRDRVCCFVLLNQYWGIIMYGARASS